MRGATNVTLQTHQILRLPRKMTTEHLAEICGKQLKRHFQCAADPNMIRSRSETVPRPFPSVRNPPRNRGHFSRSGRAFCIEKYNLSRSGYLSKFHQVLRLPRKVTLQLHQVLRLPRKVTLELHQVLRLPRKVTLELHQVLRLPRKVTLELHQVLRLPRKVTLDLHQVLRLPHRMTRRLDPRHIWNVISNARSNKCHPPNSPHTAPATQNDHPTSGRNLRKTAETSFPMRGRSEHDPITFRDRSETVSVSPQPATQQRLLFALRTNGLYWKIQHFALRLSFQISPSTAPTTKSDTSTSPSTAPTTKSDTWTSPSTAPTTKSDTWTSPSTAPTTQSDTWTSPSTAPTTKSDTWTSPSTAPTTKSDTWTSFPMRGATNVALQTHHILRLPRQMTIQHLAEICGKQLKRHFQCAADPNMIRSRSETVPRPFPSVRNPPRNRGYFSRSGRTVCIDNISRSGYLTTSSSTAACHEKWHLNFTKYCAYHEKWHLNFTKYCAYHAKVTLELHQVLRLPRKVTLELHQVLRLPRKVTLDLHQVLRLPHRMTILVT